MEIGKCSAWRARGGGGASRGGDGRTRMPSCTVDLLISKPKQPPLFVLAATAVVFLSRSSKEQKGREGKNEVSGGCC